MNLSKLRTSNRVIAASWQYFGLLIIWAHVPLAAQEEPPVTTLVLDTPETKEGVPSSHSTVFSGLPHRFEWGFRSETEQSGSPRLSLYRILSSTVVPIEENLILAPSIDLRPGEISVVGYQFDVPEASSEVRYLAKLWFEIKGNATLVGTRTILAIPKDLLSQHRGLNLLLCGFEREEDSFKKLFESFSWVVATAKTVPETITANIVITAPNTDGFKDGDGATLIYRDLTQAGDSRTPTVSLTWNGDGGKRVRYEIPANQWASVPSSAASQHRLASIISELQKSP